MRRINKERQNIHPAYFDYFDDCVPKRSKKKAHHNALAVNYAQSKKKQWIKYGFITGIIILFFPVYHYFFYSPSRQQIQVKRISVPVISASQESVAAYSEKIDQISSVLRYLLERSKRYDKALLHAQIINVSEEIRNKNSTTKKKEPFLIAHVIVSKANLRPRPDINTKPIMTLSKDAKLLIEKRAGEWIKVIAPTGSKAWISNKVVKVEDLSWESF